MNNNYCKLNEKYIENGMYIWTNITDKNITLIEAMNNVYKSVREYAAARMGNTDKYRTRIDILIAKLLCNIDDLAKEVKECKLKNCQDKQEN